MLANTLSSHHREANLAIPCSRTSPGSPMAQDQPLLLALAASCAAWPSCHLPLFSPQPGESTSYSPVQGYYFSSSPERAGHGPSSTGLLRESKMSKTKILTPQQTIPKKSTMKTRTENSKRVERENRCDPHLARAPRAVRLH